MYDKKYIFGFSVLFVSLLFFQPAFGSTDQQPREQSAYSKAVAQLRTNASNLYVYDDSIFHNPRYIRMSDMIMDWQSDDLTERSYQFLETYKDLYSIKDPHQELRLTSKEQDELGMTHVVLQQYVDTIPVYSARLAIHFRKNGSISSVNGSYLPMDDSFKTQPRVSRDEAVKIAQDDLRLLLGGGTHQTAGLELSASDAKLYLYNQALVDHTSQSLNRQSWKFSIQSSVGAISFTYFIDAESGVVIKRSDNIEHAQQRETYALADCHDIYGTLKYNEEGQIGEYEEQSYDAHNYAGYAYQYYNAVHGRDSYDYRGGLIKSYTHFEATNPDNGSCEQYVNAGWQGNVDNDYILYGEDMVDIDVSEHEFTHAVVQYSIGDTDEDSFERDSETGALSESYPDIFSIFVQNYLDPYHLNWTIGEDLPAGADSRDFANPAAEGDYSNVQEIVGGESIYTLMGIPNNALYLIVNSGTNPYSGFSVQNGIGISAAEKIYYRALTAQYMNITANFVDSYNATMQSCIDNYEIDNIAYPLSYCGTIYSAFNAVGVHDDPSFLYADIQASPPDDLAPASVDFDASRSIAVGSTIVDYAWNFGDGATGTGVNASHYYALPGDYPVTLTITDSDAQTKYAYYYFTALNPIQPMFTFSGHDVDAPATVSFDASATTDATGTISTHTWDFGDGKDPVTKISPTVTYRYRDNGYYTTQLTVSDDHGISNTYYQSFYVGAGDVTIINGNVYNDSWTTDNDPYIIQNAYIPSGSTLTIEPGVVIKFADSTSTLSVSGTLNAAGTVTEPIVFTSFKDDVNGGDTNGDGDATMPSPGDWRCIWVFTDSTALIDNVVIQYGGTYPYYSMVWLLSNDVTIQHSNLANSQYHVIEVDGAVAPIISNNVLTGSDLSTGYDIYLHNGAQPVIEYNTISHGQYGIFLADGSPIIQHNQFNDIMIFGFWELYEGNSITITDNIFTNLYAPISLNGLSTDKIVTGNSGSNNDANGIILNGSTLGDVEISYTNNDLQYILGYLTVSYGSTLTITPGTILKVNPSGLAINVYGTLDAVGTAGEPIVFTSFFDDLYGGDINNDGNATFPTAGDWDCIHFWSASSSNFVHTLIQYGGYEGYNNYPMMWIESDNVSIQDSTLAYSANHILQISNASPNITNTNIIGFHTEDLQYSGYYGIYITGESNPIIENNSISNNYVGVHVAQSSPTITTNIFFENSTGIYVGYNEDPAALAPIVTGNIFNENSIPIELYELNDNMEVTGNSGTGNALNGIFLSEIIIGDVTLDDLNNSFVYLFGNSLINADNLTLNPGTVIKFRDQSSSLHNYGAYIIAGTVDEPVVLTSIKDDEYGGDTNNDGTATTPAAGDWSHVYFASGSTGSIDYAIIRYGGYQTEYADTYGMVRVESDNVTIQNSILTQSTDYILEINSASPHITNNVITGSDANGVYHGNRLNIYIHGTASPTIDHNLINRSYKGIYVLESSPVIQWNTLANNTYAVYVYGNGTPVLSENSITGNSSYGLYNENSIATVIAENNWWGDASGPHAIPANPTGTGDSVNQRVDFNPWLTEDPLGVDNTPPTDVILGTVNKDVWSKNITLNWTNPDDVDFHHVRITRTSPTGTITLSDAEVGTTYIDSSINYNTTYTYTVYALDNADNISTGVNTANQKINSPTPKNLTLAPGNTTIDASWSATTAPANTVGGYKLYYGTAPNALTNVINVGKNTSATITGLTNGTTYYVAVVAYSKAGIESPKSSSRSATPTP